MGDRSGLRVVVRTRLGSLEPAWDALVEHLPLPSPFLRSWWLEQTAGGVPHFLLVMDEDSLVGGLALQEERWLGMSRLRVMGAGALCPDHLDAVALPDREEEVLAALAAWLRRPGSRVLDLEGVAGGSRLAAALPGRVRRKVIAVAPWAPLAADSADWLRTRPRGFRATLRKATRRLEQEAVTHRVLRGASVDIALANLWRLHHTQWGRREPVPERTVARAPLAERRDRPAPQGGRGRRSARAGRGRPPAGRRAVQAELRLGRTGTRPTPGRARGGRAPGAGHARPERPGAEACGPPAPATARALTSPGAAFRYSRRGAGAAVGRRRAWR